MIYDDGVCINCGGNEFDDVYAGKDRAHGLPGKFKIIRCVQCGLYYLRPQLSPEDMKPYYPGDYICYIEAVEDEKNVFRRLDRYLGREKRCRQITKRVVQEGKILDVGCATGIFLSGMQRRGWECFGVELDERAAEYARERFGLEIFNGYLSEAGFADDTFDVVTLWDVLEHVHDPNSVLREVQRILKPGGWLVLSLPNADAWEKKLFGPFWVGWDVPVHYRTFTRDTIKAYIEKFHFYRIKLFSFTGRHGTFMRSFSFWLRECPFKPKLKTVLFTIMNSVLIRILMLPWFIFSEKLNCSTTMSLTARKL